jgi:hypothetical protein
MTLPCAQTIDDLLADPLIEAVMRADGVERDALKAMLGDVAVKLADVSTVRARATVRPWVLGRPLIALRTPPAARFAGCQARAC